MFSRVARCVCMHLYILTRVLHVLCISKLLFDVVQMILKIQHQKKINLNASNHNMRSVTLGDKINTRSTSELMIEAPFVWRNLHLTSRQHGICYYFAWRSTDSPQHPFHIITSHLICSFHLITVG